MAMASSSPEIRTRVITPEYEAGWERSFGGEQHERRQGRTRYVYDEQLGKLVEIGSDWVPTHTRAPVVGDAHYDGLRTTDGVDVSSRRKHRDYMKATGLTLASDYTETWKRAEKDRREGAPTERRERREALGRAIYEYEKKGGSL